MKLRVVSPAVTIYASYGECSCRKYNTFLEALGSFAARGATYIQFHPGLLVCVREDCCCADYEE